jgi:hypothetical protein
MLFCSLTTGYAAVEYGTKPERGFRATLMNVKQSNTQIFRLMVYRRALHPELFDLQGRRTSKQENYETECWMIPAGHVARFQADGHVLTETVIEQGDHLPETGLLHALPCLGEKEYQFEPARQDKCGYVTTIQTELLTDNLYAATFREMVDFAREVNAQAYQWKDEEGVPCLSVLDSQHYKREFHIQSYHLLGGSGLVLRTQSIFEVR